MDLKAARNQNATVDRLTRAAMMICFLATGTLLIGALAFDTFREGSILKLPFVYSSTAR